MEERMIGDEAVVTLEDLVKLNVKLKEVVTQWEQSHSAWQHLADQADRLIRDLEGDYGDEYYAWWRIRGISMAFKMASIICAILSGIILWSEVTLGITWVDLSIISRITHSSLISSRSIDWISYATLMYMAICTYSSFMQLRVLHLYKLIPHRHTDDKSLLFFGAMFSRFIFPLGYNYLCMVEGGASEERILITEFSRVMGEMDLVPLLGRGFALYVPIALLIVCTTILFRWHRRLRIMLGMAEGWTGVDGETKSFRVAEGRILIERHIDHGR